MRTKKLLNKILRYYLGFGLLLLLLTVPLFYIFYAKYYAHEINEYLIEQCDKIKVQSLCSLKIEEISTWNRFNVDQTILPDAGQEQENRFVREILYNEREKNNQPYVVLYSKIEIEDEPFILKLRMNTYEESKMIKNSAIFLLILFIILMAGVVLATRLIYRYLWKPFYQTLSQIEQFNIRNNKLPQFLPTDTTEFIQLNNALERLATDNLNTYKIQKEFTENASHEMQTPLAVFQSKLDILLQNTDLTEDQSQIVQSLYDATSRLVRMNKNLLLLAKIDNLQFPHTQPINVIDTINESLSFLSEQAEARMLDIKSTIAIDTFMVQSDRSLLEILINNLIINAIRHNIPYGSILISFEGNRLSIANTGANDLLDEKVLFRRFGRMTQQAQGSGLGLSIAHQICMLNAWQIKYVFRDGMHRFLVTF